jgi:hypothetical protein
MKEKADVFVMVNALIQHVSGLGVCMPPELFWHHHMVMEVRRKRTVAGG